MIPMISWENTLIWKFEDVQKLDDDGMYSHKFTFENIDWKIYIGTFTENNVKYLSIHLCYDNANKNERNWICKTRRLLRLLNKKSTGKDLTKESIAIYDADKTDLGYRTYIEYSKLESDGFLKNDSIVVEIDLCFKYYDFSKNIEHFTDVTLIVKDTKFYVNKGILCSQSKYFYKLFVTENDQKKNIAMIGVDVMDFLYLIAAFCPSFQHVQLQNFETLIELANKYEVETLHSNCEKILIFTNEMGIFEKFKYAEKHNYHQLMKFCLASLKSSQEIKELRTCVEFHSFKESTKLCIMNRLLDVS